MKDCPKCFEFLFASARVCTECGHEFPIVEGEINLDTVASSAPVLSTQKLEPTWAAVSEVTYSRHEKPGSPPSMMVEYRCGASKYREWICFEHVGRARANAMQWWMSMANGIIPATIDEALRRQDEIERPERVGVLKEGKYMRVVGYGMGEAQA